MTEDELPPLDDLEAWKARFGEYRHIPLIRYGAFRIDREWERWPSHPNEILTRRQLVFEVNDQYEFDVTRNLDHAWYTRFRVRLAEGQVPTRAQLLHIVLRWWTGACPVLGGEGSLACYRRRVGPADDKDAMTPGDWYINPLFRRPSDPMISMTEVAPFAESAIRQLEQAGADEGAKGPSPDA